MDRAYWDMWYATHSPAARRSDFAQFCTESLGDFTGRIVDVGCGNGRDTLFFARNHIASTGLDQSETIIKANVQSAKEQGLDAEFACADFSRCDYDELVGGPFVIYSRFTLHAINYEEEERFLSTLRACEHMSHLLIEVRSLQDDLYGKGEEVGRHEFVTSHYRRFIDPEELREKLEGDFKIVHFSESQGYSKTETDDPYLIRIIAQRL
jgi:tellurite methyltransferase